MEKLHLGVYGCGEMFRRRRKNLKDALIYGLEVAVGDSAHREVIEVVEPIPDFTAAFDADDWDVGVGGKNEQVETAADNDTALRGTGLDNGWVRAFKQFNVGLLWKL